MQRFIVLTVVIAAAVFALDVDETIPELYVDETSAEVLPKPATTMTATSSSSSCPALTASGPVTVENDGQVIENLDITAGDSTFNSASTATNKWTAVPGITCYGKKDVVIRNVRVTHYPQGKDAIAGSSAATYWAAVLAEHPDEDKTVTTTTTTTTGTSIDEEEYEYDFVATNSKVKGSSIPAGAREAPYSNGIYFNNCENIKIENVRVLLVGAPTIPAGASTGAFTSFNNYNILGRNTAKPVIQNVILSGGSSGVWLGDTTEATLTNWAAYNVHGPFPRGQCTQFSRSPDGHVSNFICKNQWQYSYPEDAISFWRSANSTIKDGVIIGNSATTGVGLMFEQSSVLENSWGLAENIQAAHIGGCCFSAYGGTGIDFKNVGCRDNHCDGRGNRGPGSGLMFYAGWENPDNYDNCCYSSNQSVTGEYYNSCRSPVLWQDNSKNPDAWVKTELTKNDFTLNEHPVQVDLCFTIDGQEYKASTAAGTSAEHVANIGLFGTGSIDDNSSYDKDAVNRWNAGKTCDETGCRGDGTSSTAWLVAKAWSTKCGWGKCQGCTECDDFYVSEEAEQAEPVVPEA